MQHTTEKTTVILNPAAADGEAHEQWPAVRRLMAGYGIPHEMVPAGPGEEAGSIGRSPS